MPKLVCVKDEVELLPFHNGTIVVEMASFGPYKVWNADAWKCPICGFEIIAGFGNNPLRSDHYSPDFPEWLENTKKNATQVIYDKELVYNQGK